MPKYFHWHSPNNEWDQQLSTFRCSGYNKNGTRCKRNVIIGLPYCFQHTASIYNLKVKQSTIPNAGLGLFALDKTKNDNDIVFKNNEIICPYHGEVINKDELIKRYNVYTAPYGIQVKNNMYEDGALQRGIGSLINHKTRIQSNCKFTGNYRDIKIKAIKNIRNGQELFVSYGNEYRFNDETQYSTNNRKKH